MKYPRGTHTIVGRDLKQVKSGACATMRQSLDERGIVHTYNRSDGSIFIHENGCRVIPRSANNFLSFRGLEADSIWADEVADWGVRGEEAFARYLVSRCRPSPGGKVYKGLMPQMRFTTNPPTSTGHWLVKLLRTDNKWSKYWTLSTRDNYLLLERDPTYVERLERTYPPDMWPIIIDGNFGNATSGMVYSTFAWETHCQPPTAPLPPMGYNPDKPLCLACDFNVGLMCWVVSQPVTQRVYVVKPQVWNPLQIVTKQEYQRRVEVEGYQERMWYVLDEIRIEDCGTPDATDEFVRRWGPQARKNGVVIYGDASGGSRAQAISSQAAARSNWKIIIEELRRQRIPIRAFKVPMVNPSVLDRVNASKAQLRNKDGIGVLIDDVRAPNLVKDYQAVQWRPAVKNNDGSTTGRLNEIDKADPDLTHLSDAFGYQIWMERELAARRPPDMQRITTLR
jgi:hypothetical protein